MCETLNNSTHVMGASWRSRFKPRRDMALEWTQVGSGLADQLYSQSIVREQTVQDFESSQLTILPISILLFESKGGMQAMHKGIILLTKAENNQIAKSNIEEFLVGYKDDVWDWYQIGGRWNGSLNAKNKEFGDKAKLVLAEHSSNQKDDGAPRDDGFITCESIKETQGTLQQIWIDLEQSGPNPYCDHYKLPDEGADYDIMPLVDCLNIVTDWQQDHIKDGNTELESAKGWLDGTRGTNDYTMYGYSLKIAANIFAQNFCSDCNVFNIHKYNYSIPDDATGWFAVIIDIHS